MLHVCDRFKMSLPEVKELPMGDYKLMEAYLEKHPIGQAESILWAKLLAIHVNKDIDRTSHPEGVSPVDMVPWLNQEEPDHLLTPSELEERERKQNEVALKALFAALDE